MNTRKSLLSKIVFAFRYCAPCRKALLKEDKIHASYFCVTCVEKTEFAAYMVMKALMRYEQETQ